MTNERNSFVFSKERCKNLNSTWTWYRTVNAPMSHSLPQPLRRRNNAAPPTLRCPRACRSRCALDMMPRRRRFDAPQSAAAAILVIALVAFLHVCLWLGATTVPSEVCNGCRCVVEVPTVSHFGGYNHRNADSDSTLIECAGCNMWWWSNVYHHNDNDNDGKSFRYVMQRYWHTQLVDVSCRDLLKQRARFRE